MPSQHQFVQTPKFSSELTITFMLTGRTTLSEHLPSESIDVPFSLASRSLYLHKLIIQNTTTRAHTSHANAVLLPDIDPAGFKIFLDYLSNGKITFPCPKLPSNAHNLSLRECIDLLYAHTAGGILQEPEFQDHVMDEMSRILSSKQSFDQKVLDVVFVDRKAASVLRDFIVDTMFAEDRKMVVMLRGGVRDAVAGDLGERGGSKPGEHEKAWDANEDPDLVAMAEYCLTRTDTAFTGSTPKDCVSSGKRVKVEQHRRRRSVVFVDTQIQIEKDNESSTFRESSMSSGTSFDIQKEKPLPALPATSISSPQNTFSPEVPQAFPTLPSNWEKDKAQQSLVERELYRRRRSECSVDVNTHDIVAECLDRFTRSTTAVGSRSCDAHKLSGKVISTIKSREVQEHDDLPLSLRAGSPSYACFDTSAAPSRSNIVSSIPAAEAAWVTVDSMPRPPIDRTTSLYLPPMVKRKAAPSRGSDWLEQQERLYMLQGTQGFGLRRIEKKSWFFMMQELFSAVKRSGDGRPRSAA
ncbi:hypothetical protein NX059_001375 [Plenodomus lindquistii]|nr:hypothetical protein NX059_001375 [Plenodomus lindquistii]